MVRSSRRSEGESCSAPGRPTTTMMQRLGQKDADGEDEFWMPDDKVTFCIGCERKFTFWYRKHHCRVCGRIFCAACSSHVISGLTLGKASPDPVRACDACFEQKSQPHPSEAPGGVAPLAALMPESYIHMRAVPGPPLGGMYA